MFPTKIVEGYQQGRKVNYYFSWYRSKYLQKDYEGQAFCFKLDETTMSQVKNNMMHISGTTVEMPRRLSLRTVGHCLAESFESLFRICSGKLLNWMHLKHCKIKRLKNLDTQI